MNSFLIQWKLTLGTVRLKIRAMMHHTKRVKIRVTTLCMMRVRVGVVINV